MNEKRLVKALAAGNTGALGEIIGAYSGYVCAVMRNLSGGSLSEEDLDELAADVFYRLWEHRGNITPEMGLRPYLATMARNAAINRLKRETSFSDISELDIAADIIVEEKAELNAMMSCLEEGMETLSEDEREIFFRFYFYGEKCAVIAKTMSLPENTVYTKLRRTREKLKDFLTERGFDHV